MASRTTSTPTPLSPPAHEWSRRGGPLLDRRTAVVRGVATIGLLGGGAALVGCSTSSGPDASTTIALRLAPLARAASEDALAARALAARVPDRAGALRVIADERDVHARTLTDEVSRLSADALPSASPASTSAGSPPPPPVAADVTALRGRLSGARSATADLAIASDGYRAGMLGSIAASLATLVEVQLG